MFYCLPQQLNSRLLCWLVGGEEFTQISLFSRQIKRRERERDGKLKEKKIHNLELTLENEPKSRLKFYLKKLCNICAVANVPLVLLFSVVQTY